MLAKTMAEVRSGQLETKVATAIAYVAHPLLKALESEEVETRLNELERLIKGETGGHSKSS